MVDGKLAVVLAIALVGMCVSPVQAQTEPPTPDKQCITDQSLPDATWDSVRAVISQPNDSPDKVRIRYEARDIPEEFFLDIPEETNLTRQSGFEWQHGELQYTGGKDPFIEYRLVGQSSYWRSSESREWTYAPLPHHSNIRPEFEIDGAGTAGNDYVYLGNYTKHTVEQGCHTVSLIVSNQSELEPDTEDVFHALQYVTSELDVGHRYDEVRVVVIPGRPDPSVEGKNHGDEAWVTSRTRGATNVSTLVIHEYVHSRQRFAGSGTADVMWFTEATATFYQMKYGYEIGAFSATQYNTALSNGSSINASLGNSSTWPSRWTEYRRGFTYVAILNEKLLAASNGTYSVEDLIRGVNSRANGTTPVILQRGLLLDRIEANGNSSVATWANDSISADGELNYSVAKVNEPSLIAVAKSGLVDRTREEPLSTLSMVSMIAALVMLGLYDIASNWLAGRSTEEQASNQKARND